MGHTVTKVDSYTLLQERLDRFVTGAPESAVFMQILRLLFSPEEAELARHIPTLPTPLPKLARRLNLPEDELHDTLRAMAERGLVMDFERKGVSYFALPPVVIGFFEYTFMRTRDDVPLAELARLFDEYMYRDGRFAQAVFAGQTQIGRSLVREEALPDGDHVEVLDWERASYLVQSAKAHAVSLCACRHKASHLGHACDQPQRTCLTLNFAADMLVRSGNAERISMSEAMATLEMCKEAGLAQTADNVKHNVSYICNCCGCCCGMMQAIRRFDIRHAIVTSNWIMDIDLEKCTGCGICAKACPVLALSLAETRENGRRKRWIVRDADLCLGCGTCYGTCKFDAIRMEPREQRVFTPEHTVDRVIAMAIERGKLADLLFDNPETFTHRSLERMIRVLERTPPVKAALAIQPLRSRFLGRMFPVRERKPAAVEV